jgi:hypothetical protein
MVSCTSPVWHGESDAKEDAVFTNAAPQGQLQQVSMKQAVITLDTQSYGEARPAGPPQSLSKPRCPSTRYSTASRHAGPAFPSFSRAAPQGRFQEVSMARDTRSFVGVPRPTPEGLPTTWPRGGEQGGATLLKAGPPRE